MDRNHANDFWLSYKLYQNQNIPMTGKSLYSFIHKFFGLEKCNPTNHYLAQKLFVSERTISKAISQLTKENCIFCSYKITNREQTNCQYQRFIQLNPEYI